MKINFPPALQFTEINKNPYNLWQIHLIWSKTCWNQFTWSTLLFKTKRLLTTFSRTSSPYFFYGFQIEKGDRRAETVNFRIRNSGIVFHVRWERETDPSILPRSNFSSIFYRFVFAMKWEHTALDTVECRDISDKLSAVCMMFLALVLWVKVKKRSPDNSTVMTLSKA